MRRQWKTGYDDPLLRLIGRLPLIDREKWSELWQSKRPHAFTRLRWWYTANDAQAITLLRVFTTMSAPALLWLNYNISSVLTIVVIGVFVTEWLSEKREALQRERWKQELEEERREYWQSKRIMDPTLP